MRSAQSLGSNMAWNSIGLLFYFGCQWLLTVFVVYFKGGYTDAGVLSLAMSLANVLTMVASLNLRTFQVSELEGRFSDGDFLCNRALTSGAALILCIFVVIYKGYSRYEGLCIFAFMLFKVSEALGDVFHGMDQKVWRLDIAGKSFLLRGCVTLLSICCGMLLNGNLLLTIFLMTVLSYLVIFVYDFQQCKKRVQPDFSHHQGRVWALVKIGFPLALYSMLLNLIATYPRFQIEEQYGKELLGIFASIATPTVLITQLASFIFSPLMGVFAECRKEHDRKKLYKLLLLCVGGIAVIGIISLIAGRILGKWVLVLLFGESIGDYSYLLTPIICTAILTAAIWLLCGLLTVFKDYYALAVLTLVSLMFCMLASTPLITEKHLLGAALALLGALIIEALLLIIRLFYLLRREKMLV